jgi:ferredoxin
MHKGRLYRTIRSIIALLAFLWITALLLDIHHRIPDSWFYPLRYLQLVPALQASLGLAGGAIIALATLLLLSWFFGRIYCSTLCPLGVMQDLAGRIRGWLKKKSRYRKQQTNAGWRYGFLFLFLLSVFIGSGLFTGLLDPYSHFSRIIRNLIQPPFVFANNQLAWWLTSIGSYALSPVKFHGISWASAGFSAGVFGMIIWMVWRNGRVFCNTLCPVGTLLGLPGKRALLGIRMDHTACTSCGLCAVVCKAGCIDVKKKEIDNSRCVLCFNCIPACDLGGIRYGKAVPVETDFSRRDTLLRAGTTLILPAVLKEVSEEDKALAIRRASLSPPGSLSHANLHIQCTACHLCISTCPTGVLQPAFAEYGLSGVFQPLMDPISGYCNYDCIRCLEVCPTGAILPMTVEDKQRVQVGRARFIPELCVVTKDHTACGACSEHCPTKAVDMLPWKDGLTIPVVDTEICVGCGACEYACPTDPRSIVVDGNPIHQRAALPLIDKEEAEEASIEEFPF